MKFYLYRAVDRAGAVESGAIMATDPSDLSLKLSNRELTLLSARRNWRASLLASKSLPVTQLITFTHHLQQMLSAGVPLLDALHDLSATAGNRSTVAMIEQLTDAIDSGQCLSDACRAQPAIFNPLYCSVIEVGETSGRLAEVLEELAQLLTWQNDTAATIRKIMIYPALVSVVLVAVIFFVMTFLVPGLLSFVTSTGTQIPWHTRLLIQCSAFVSAWWPAIALAAVAVAVGLVSSYRYVSACRYQLDRLVLSIPVIGPLLYRIRVARFARCAALMYSSGIGLPDLLKLGAGVIDSEVLGRTLDNSREAIFQGETLSGALAASGNFPAMVTSMIAVGEKTGGLDFAFSQVARFYDRESRNSVDKLEQTIGPCLIMIVGSLMLWVVVSVVGPVYDLVFDLQGGF